MTRRLRFLPFLAILLLAVSALPTLAQSGGLRYSITVTEFENQAGWHAQWHLGQAWGTVMTEKLHASGRFIVLGEGGMRDAAMAEQDLAASGATAQGAKTPVTGQLTPADWLLGVSTVRMRAFLIGTGLGIIPGIVLAVTVGSAGVDLLSERWARWVLFGGLIAFAAFRRIRRARRRRAQPKPA